MKSVTKYLQINDAVWEVELREKVKHPNESWSEFQKDRNKKGRIYVWPTGESIMENLMYRRSRPHTAWKKCLPLAFEAVGLDRDTKCGWSQKAGCSCGCSPGFVLRDWTWFDMHINIYYDDQKLRKEFLHGIVVPDEQWAAAARAMVA
jgi:hypothetical protein